MKRAETNYLALVGSVSHALRGPLNSILNVADLLLAGAGRQGDAEFKRDVQEIIRDAERLSALWSRLHGLLDIDVSALDLSIVDLPEAFRTAIEDRRAAARDAGITLYWDVTGQSRPVQADAQVLISLVGRLMDHCLVFRTSPAISVTVAFMDGTYSMSVLEGEPESVGDFSDPAPLPVHRIRDEYGIELLICHWLARFIGASLWTSRKADTDQYAFHVRLPIRVAG